MASQSTDVSGKMRGTGADSLNPNGETDIARLLARRLRPPLLAIGLLLSIGFPALCLTVQYRDLKYTASGYARELAEQFRVMASKSPEPWAARVGDYFNVVHGSLPQTQVITIHLIDNDGLAIGRHDHIPSAAKKWWSPIVRGDPALLMVNGVKVGLLQVDISSTPILPNTVPMLILGIFAGIALASSFYYFPVRFARDLEGRVKKLVGNLQTAYGDIETRVDEHLRELRQAELQLTHYTAGLEKSNRELQELAYSVSHDLQEPLRGIFGFLQLLQRRYKGKLDATADEYIAQATAGATRLRDMINGALAYSRVETRGERFQAVDCGPVLEEVMANLVAPIQESQAIVTQDSLPVVLGDRSQLVHLFQNLLSNAIKFRSEKPPEIRVSAEERDGEWVFSFRDNGIGIDPRHKERIFVLFQRLHGARIPGDGIGLAICKRIVERHGGRIWVESQPGEGSVFCFILNPQCRNASNHKQRSLSNGSEADKNPAH